MAGNQTEPANENHQELHAPPSPAIPAETQTLPLDLPRACPSTPKTSRDAARNKQNPLKDVFLFSYIIPGIMAGEPGFHRIHSLAACNLGGQ